MSDVEVKPPPKRVAKPKKDWERGMPKPPPRHRVLREIIFSKIEWAIPKSASELYQEVLDDFGTVTDRSIFNHLSNMQEQGIIKKVIQDDESIGYVRTKGPRRRFSVRRQLDTHEGA